MNIKEIITNHEGSIVFYPFSGFDFKIIDTINDSLPENHLFIYCSVGGTREEYQVLESNKRASGWFLEVEHIENKMGLQEKEITFSVKLKENEKFNTTFFTLSDKTKLIFVKGEVFDFVHYLSSQGIDLLKLSIIIKGVGPWKDELTQLVKSIYCNNVETDNTLKFLLTENVYLNNIEEVFSQTEFYKSSQKIDNWTTLLYKSETIKKKFSVNRMLRYN